MSLPWHLSEQSKLTNPSKAPSKSGVSESSLNPRASQHRFEVYRSSLTVQVWYTTHNGHNYLFIRFLTSIQIQILSELLNKARFERTSFSSIFLAGSKSVAMELTSAPHNTQHSTLEVDLSQDGRTAPILCRPPGEEKIVSYDAGKQAIIFEEALPEAALPIHNEKPHPPLPVQRRQVWGMKPRMFIISLCVVLALIVATVTGGGVGGALAARKRKSGLTPTAISSPATQIAPTPTMNPSPTTRVPYANIGLAAMQWTDLNGIVHKRLYYQDNGAKIRESAWNSGMTFNAAWQVESISDAVKPGTPIAAAAGYPHASYDYSLVRVTHALL